MLKRLILLMFLGLLAAVIATPFLITSAQPQVSTSITLDAAKIDQAKAFLQRNDPRRLEPGEFATLWVDEDEITLAGNYLLNELTEGAMGLQLQTGTAYLSLSLSLPENPIGRYVNALLILSQTGSTLSVESLTLGSVTIPRSLAEPLRAFGHEQLMRLQEYRDAVQSINGMQILSQRMLVQYQWNPDLVDSIKSRGQTMMVDEDMQQRLLAYSKQIRQVIASSGSARTVSLTEVLAPVLQLAKLRDGDPVAENTAALLALSFYFSGVDVARMVGVDLPSGPGIDKKLTLSNRYDFSQHFLTSAALTLGSRSSGFADAIGLFKELDDAKGGSGFSFTDIGADRAGVKFAELATRDATSARFVQEFFLSKPGESAFMPDFLDLPELMPNDEFKRRYGNLEDPRYLAVIEDIESRFSNTRIYTEAPGG